MSIEITLAAIKEQIGLSLIPCEYFTGIFTHNGQKYFNVMLNESISESRDYNSLINICGKGIISKVEPNGVKRLAIFL